jgi:short-subunit dehydrogenase
MNVFITGAAGGLGRALASECGSRGYNLFLTDINEEGLGRIKEGLERQFNVAVTAKACDLTDPKSLDNVLAHIDAHGIRFDMVLNVAGCDFEGAFSEHEREKLVKIVLLNNAATLRVTHAILRRRRPGRRFAIVFVSSLASMFPMPLKATYAASKRFLLELALALRQELKKDGVTVLAVCPAGMVTTEETLSCIRAQGFWGNVTTALLEDVARRTLDLALSGKSVYIPGVTSRLLSLLGKIVPRSLAAAVVYRRWRHAQNLVRAEKVKS